MGDLPLIAINLFVSVRVFFKKGGKEAYFRAREKKSDDPVTTPLISPRDSYRNSTRSNASALRNVIKIERGKTKFKIQKEKKLSDANKMEKRGNVQLARELLASDAN
jgi:hypothetical protein